MNQRPRIEMKLTNTDKIFEWIGWWLLGFFWIYVIFNYSSLPDTIPIHYNFKGEVDGYGTKSSIFLLPILGTIIFIGMTILNKYPHVFNYPVKITTENAEKQYVSATRLIRYLKLAVLFIFLLIILNTLQIDSNSDSKVSFWILPAALVLIFIPLILYIVNSFRTR